MQKACEQILAHLRCLMNLVAAGARPEEIYYDILRASSCSWDISPAQFRPSPFRAEYTCIKHLHHLGSIPFARKLLRSRLIHYVVWSIILWATLRILTSRKSRLRGTHQSLLSSADVHRN